MSINICPMNSPINISEVDRKGKCTDKCNYQIGYKGSEIHRIVNGMYIQLGRIKHSIGFANKFNAEFEDESFCIKHTEIGLLGMCKRSGLKHSNES